MGCDRSRQESLCRLLDVWANVRFWPKPSDDTDSTTGATSPNSEIRTLMILISCARLLARARRWCGALLEGTQNVLRSVSIFSPRDRTLSVWRMTKKSYPKASWLGSSFRPFCPGPEQAAPCPMFQSLSHFLTDQRRRPWLSVFM